MANILVVDDDDFVSRSIGALIEAEGHTVERALNGVAAVEMVKNKAFDLLVTDIRMSPMDGLELLTAARAAKPDMPVVVVSALTSEKIVASAKQLGASEYVKKPFRIEDILSAISRALKK